MEENSTAGQRYWREESLGVLGCSRVRESPTGRRQEGGGDSRRGDEGECGEGGKCGRTGMISFVVRREGERGEEGTRKWCDRKSGKRNTREG